jgi:2',3'-cyclic-nucleotide 2'-phosphodiesterase (5'-nucleotidase family)
LTNSSLIILHTNDIHGRVEGLARVATLVQQIRADNPGTPVLYFDLGDVEEPSRRLSNVTKGAGMHRLLNAAGCDAAVAGNGAWLRYGPQVLAEHGAAARYPLLLANLRTSDGKPLAGVQPTCLLEAGSVRLGLIGVTTDTAEWLSFFDLSAVPAPALIRELGASLRQDGADAILLLSHMGLPADLELAAGLQENVTAVLGGHTHNLLPEGERVGRVMVAQAGQYAEHLGRLDLSWDREQLTVAQASVITVTENFLPSPVVVTEAAVVEAECEHYLAESIGELAEPLDFAANRECGVGNLMADMLRLRMGGEVAMVAAGHAFTGPLPAGPLTRGMLWDVCNTTANPALVEMSGTQLVALVTKGLDLAFAADRPHTLRGHPRGLLHLSGATVHDGQVQIGGQPVAPTAIYRVAGSDWEFESYGGYTNASWELRPRYEVPTILREALEEYLAAHSPIRGTLGRLG